MKQAISLIQYQLDLSIKRYQFSYKSAMHHNPITEKYQLIDDESAFRLEELEGLANQKIQSFAKNYHIVSVIGSQSSGKSSLLNAVFNTEFDVLNRKKRVGQTTKGIWYSVDVPSHMIILDVEGSDSNERQQRIKIERRNSLFALSVSHTLLINLWIQQIGLYKGSQLAILQIILQLNLKLFGSQKPKQIIFVVRDFIAEQENRDALRQKLFTKVGEAWQNIPKPPGKQEIKLNDLFHLEAFFLPSKIEEKDEFMEAVGSLRKFLQTHSQESAITKDNVPMQDLPLYMQNLWQTIQADKDINLPQQKILLSNMRCQEVQKQVYQDNQEQFRDELEKSERKMNFNFSHNVKQIVNRMLDRYNELTVSYIKEEVEKVRGQFVEFLERKIELSFSYQIRLISEECLKEFLQDVNRNFLKEKSIEAIKSLRPEIIEKFKKYAHQVAYKEEWARIQIQKFEKTVQNSFQHQKQKIISESLKDFDRTIKKQIQGLVSNAFYDKKIFCEGFWQYINKGFRDIQHKAKNSIVSLYSKFEMKEKDNQPLNKKISKHVDKARFNANEELRTIIEMKCNDLLYYVMRHFSVDFTMDDKQIPRQWVDMKLQQITALYQSCKQKYLKILENFKTFKLQEEDDKPASQKFKVATRMSYIESSNDIQQLLKAKDLKSLHKKLEEQMNNVYEEALKKNKEVYQGSIPTWGWVLFLLVAFDDILVWFHSPYLTVPLALILVLVIIVLVFGGKSAVGNIVNSVKRATGNVVTNLTARAAGSMLKRD